MADIDPNEPPLFDLEDIFEPDVEGDDSRGGLVLEGVNIPFELLEFGNAAPSGTLLAPRDTPGDVRSIWGAGGTALFWPPELPGGDPSTPAGLRAESLVVVVADRRQDLSSLAAPAASRGAGDLNAVLAGAGTGTRADGEIFRYRVETIDFLVSP